MKQIAKMLRKKGLEASSRKSYESKIRTWKLFCGKAKISKNEVTEKNLCLFVAWRYRNSSVKESTMDKEISAIISKQIDRGNFVDRSEMTLLRRTLRGVKKDPTRQSKQRKAIHNGVLRKILAPLGTENFDSQVLRAAILMGKFAMLRVGEYTSNTQRSPRTAREKLTQMRIKNLKFFPNFKKVELIRVNLKKSKTNQFGKLEFVSFPCTCPGLCAVHELRSMLKRRKMKSLNEPLFQLKDGRVLTAKYLGNAIHNLCKKCGLDPNQYTPHSLRRGGVTDLVKRGVDDEVIRRLARWAPGSEMLNLYTCLSANECATLASS